MVQFGVKISTLSKFALRARFDKARAAAKKKAEQVLSQAKTTAEKTEIAAMIEAVGRVQFRDFRAKAGTDKAEAAGIGAETRSIRPGDSQQLRTNGFCGPK